MPHCIIELSESLESQSETIIRCVHDAAEASGLFDCRDIKTRSRVYRDFILGDDSDHFIIVTIRLLSGRTKEQKQQLVQSTLHQLKALAISDAALFVELCDIDRDAYAKT